MMRSEHSFRLASLSFDQLDANGEPCKPTVRMDFGTAEAMWGYVASFARTFHRLHVFAHNLSYDLRLSNGLHWLPHYGYEVKQIGLGSYATWARFSDGSRTIWLQDSLSFAPKDLNGIAELVQMRKPPLPDDSDNDAVWLDRCRSDVEITREAILRIIRYIKQNDLGDFRLTGAAQSSAAFRHKFLSERSLLVHDNEEALEAERRSAWTGRAEVWKHGKTASVLHEYDYEYAYARLAYECEVPSKLIASHSGIPIQRLEKVMDKYAVCADVVVSTDMPTVPASNDGGIIWPIGRFRTTLWDRELRLCLARGAKVDVERYWFYKKEPLLRDWAVWILDELNKSSAEVDPIARLMLKDWSRALIGRFGLRYNLLDEIAVTPTSDVALRTMYDVDQKVNLRYLYVGHRILEQTGKVESPNSTPMVMAYIMAAARVKLWEAMEVAGLDNVFYVDTDGLIVSPKGRSKLETAIRDGKLAGLRRKSAWNGGDFRSARNVDLGEIRRVVGAPKRAERLSPGIYRGEVWESLPAALKQRHLGRVFVHERTFQISEQDKRRGHLDGGLTEPLRLDLDSAKEIASAA